MLKTIYQQLTSLLYQLKGLVLWVFTKRTPKIYSIDTSFDKQAYKDVCKDYQNILKEYKQLINDGRALGLESLKPNETTNKKINKEVDDNQQGVLKDSVGISIVFTQDKLYIQYQWPDNSTTSALTLSALLCRLNKGLLGIAIYEALQQYSEAYPDEQTFVQEVLIGWEALNKEVDNQPVILPSEVIPSTIVPQN